MICEADLIFVALVFLHCAQNGATEIHRHGSSERDGILGHWALAQEPSPGAAPTNQAPPAAAANLAAATVTGLKLRGDLGVLFADKEGLFTTERVYWSNHATGLVADVPGEARLHPDRWGELEVQ